jgi:hypothetical protein
MLRLTVRSGRDGRYLGTIVDRGGFPFVLDFGDRRLIEDAHQRILHGFTVIRFGELITALPRDPKALELLADFYLREGMLVHFEEPTWDGRTGRPDHELGDLATEAPGDQPTEEISRAELTRARPR